MNGRQLLADALKNFTYSLAQGMAASSQAPGRRGSQLGMAAAFGAPMQLREMERKREEEEAERRFRLDQFRQMVGQNDIENAMRMIPLMTGQANPTIPAANPQATPMSYPGQVGQGPTMGGGTQQVMRPNPPITVPLRTGPMTVTPPNAQQLAIQKMEELRKQAQIQQEFAPPRNIDPLSDAGQAAQINIANARPVATKSLQTTDIDDPDKPGSPLKAIFDPDSGNIIHPTTRMIIPLPKPYREPDKPQAEAGQYLPITDQQGRVTKWVNPKTRQVVTAQELGITDEAYRGPMSPERQKMQENAKSGLRAIATLREELKKPGMLAALAVPTSPLARKARAARGEMIDVMTRLRTGAALNNQEQAFYRDQAPGLIDALFADPETINYKLSIFENEFKGLAGESGGPKVGTVEDGFEFLGGDPANPKNWKKK